MTREECAMVGVEIVAYAGDARTKLLDALNAAEQGDFQKAEMLIDDAQKDIVTAHKTQTGMLSKEAAGEDIEMSFIMIHAQDHLMTVLLLKDLIKHLLELYKRG